MRLHTLIISLVVSLACLAADTGAVKARADRAYAAGEWASAGALYMLATNTEAPEARSFGRIIVCAIMRSDSTVTVPEIERALSAHVPLDSVLGIVSDETRTLGRPQAFEKELTRIAANLPYLRRPLDSHFLRYYTGRADGDNIIFYARRMLAGLPESPVYLNALAYGYLLNADYDAAEKTWLAVLAAAPDNAEALNGLGNLLLTTDRSRALDYLRHAYRVAPTPYLSSLIKQYSN